jgi:regulatory protein
MTAAGYGSDDIEETIEFLSERRYLNDESFAADFARNAAKFRHWGPARIEQRLHELGLSQAHIALAIEQSFAEGELEAAGRALARYLRLRPIRRDEGIEAVRGRAYRHLVARGFSPEVAYERQSSIIMENIEVTDQVEPAEDDPDYGRSGSGNPTESD